MAQYADVFVSVTTYKSRAHRDELNAKPMKAPRMAGMDPQTMPLDGNRTFFGGFKHFIGN